MSISATDNVSTTPRVLASGLGFVEGPLWTADGRLLVASLNRGRIYEIAPESGAVVEVAEVGGGPNCLGQDRTGGDLWATQTSGAVMPSRSERPTRTGLQRIRLGAGEIYDIPLPLADSPSDCVVDADGLVWFTDPPIHDVADAPPTGTVRVYNPHDGELTTAAGGIAFPNGLAFSSDERHLYVAETATRRILRYERDGLQLHRDGWSATLPCGHPDGLAVDGVGGVWVAGSVGANLYYVAADGTIGVEVRFPVGSLITSVCFIGSESEALAVTNAKGGRVYSLRPPPPHNTNRSLP